MKKGLTCEDAINSIYDEYATVDKNRINKLFNKGGNDENLAQQLANIIDSIGADKNVPEQKVIDDAIRYVMSSKASSQMQDNELIPMIIEHIMHNDVYRDAAHLAKTDTAARILNYLYKVSYDLGHRRYSKYIAQVLEQKYYHR